MAFKGIFMNWRIIIFLFLFISSPCYCGPGDSSFSGEKATIKVSVSSNVYTYTIKNISEAQINSVEFKPHSSYNFQAPEGWTFDEDRPFFAESEKQAAIDKDRSEKFSIRASSGGSVLGQSPVLIGFTDGSMEIIDGVWSPVRESSFSSIAILVTVVTIFILHSLWALGKKGKSAT